MFVLNDLSLKQKFVYQNDWNIQVSTIIFKFFYNPYKPGILFFCQFWYKV